MSEQRDPVIRVMAMPKDTSFGNAVFGGWLMSQMDIAAGLVAARRAEGRIVTVATDAMQFHLPVKVGDVISVYCEVVSVGRTSMKISVEATRSQRYSSKEAKVTEAVFSFVAVDDEGRPRAVPEE